jgi:hypothetical protein
MKKTIFSILTGAIFSLSANAADSAQVAESVKSQVSQVAGDNAKVLEVVSKEVAAAPKSAGEIVKAAILASKASAKMVAAIVEAAVNAAPDEINAIIHFALAAAPDALSEVQAVAAKFPELLGKINPLNFPGYGPVGPTPGGPGGLWLVQQLLVSLGVIAPPFVTEVNPRGAPGGSVVITNQSGSWLELNAGNVNAGNIN